MIRKCTFLQVCWKNIETEKTEIRLWDRWLTWVEPFAGSDAAAKAKSRSVKQARYRMFTLHSNFCFLDLQWGNIVSQTVFSDLGKVGRFIHSWTFRRTGQTIQFKLMLFVFRYYIIKMDSFMCYLSLYSSTLFFTFNISDRWHNLWTQTQMSSVRVKLLRWIVGLLKVYSHFSSLILVLKVPWRCKFNLSSLSSSPFPNVHLSCRSLWYFPSYWFKDVLRSHFKFHQLSYPLLER